MALQFSVTVRNARADAIETAIGASPILEIRSGAAPADCAAADSGTLLASMTLPTDWLAAAASGVKSMLGVWTDASANAAGTAGHFRLKDSPGTTCHTQGTVTATGGGGDLQLLTTTIVILQPVTITSWATTEGNA